MIIETVEDNVSGVYLIQCNKNGKNYIGSSKNIKERWREHISCLRDKRHHSMKLQEDWDKFGEDQFEFHILVKTDYANAKKLEDEYIKKFKSDKFGYNTDDFKTNMNKRDNMRCNQILEYISETYKADGNTYCYDAFKMAKYLKIPISELLKFLGINRSDKFNVHRSLDNETSIGINWDNEDMFIEVVNVRNYEKDSDFILVDVA